MRFKRKPIECEAYLYKKDFLNAPKWVKEMDFKISRCGIINYYGEPILEDETYIVKDNYGEIEIWNKNVFLKEFEEV